MEKNFPWKNTPITQDAEKTISEAYTTDSENKNDTVTTATNKPEQGEGVSSNGTTDKLDERLRKGWEVYQNKYANAIEIGANVKVPESIDDRLEAIGKRMRKRKGDMKMPKKRLILLALMEFVEKYDK